MAKSDTLVTAVSAEQAIADTIAAHRAADQKFMKNLRPNFLKKLKAEPLETVHGSKAYEPYFGAIYTAFCNTIPVTIRFDGTEQKFPKSIAVWLRNKIAKTTEANAPKKTDDIMLR